MFHMTDDLLDSLFQGLPMLPVPASLQEKLDNLLMKVEKGELYQEDAGPGSQGQPQEER